jgi:hypothetical protein
MNTNLVEITLLMRQSFFELLELIEDKYKLTRAEIVHISVGLYSRNRIESTKRNRLASIRPDNTIVRVYEEIPSNDLTELTEIILYVHQSLDSALQILAYSDRKTRAEIVHESVHLYEKYMADLAKGYRLASIRPDNSIETIY